jgi:excisionase family DNA binding protein
VRASQDIRIDPSALSSESLQRLTKLCRDGETAAIVGKSGEKVTLPTELRRALAFVLGAFEKHQSVCLIPEDEPFTTQAAANFLGMSRPYLMRLLDAGEIPFHRVGTHRRVLYRDLIAFQERRSSTRKAALSKMTNELVEAGVYDRVAKLERDA